ncbi:hypothetical protein KCTC52924_00546 [Arenibacter antarcticus]|uniref:Uncharacterized protein n=1 Tax=Arenibacter antarcticus TaxID=2040469 RepID=A0ABW5VDJ9_9FLAO|nr:hypothetical protein [Arenibacter sp. H213]
MKVIFVPKVLLEVSRWGVFLLILGAANVLKAQKIIDLKDDALVLNSSVPIMYLII